jgi:hypothetical protein
MRFLRLCSSVFQRDRWWCTTLYTFTSCWPLLIRTTLFIQIPCEFYDSQKNILPPPSGRFRRSNDLKDQWPQLALAFGRQIFRTIPHWWTIEVELHHRPLPPSSPELIDQCMYRKSILTVYSKVRDKLEPFCDLLSCSVCGAKVTETDIRYVTARFDEFARALELLYRATIKPTLCRLTQADTFTNFSQPSA